MIKGIIGSLIAAAVFFAAGEITVRVFGTKSLGEKEFEDMELFEGAPAMTELVSEIKFVGERTWEFDAAETLGIISDRVNTKVRRIDGDKITLTVKTTGAKNATIAVSGNKDSHLGISVRENGVLFFNGSSTNVEIGIPDKVLAGLEIQLGSGELKASEIKAQTQILDIRSGEMKYEQAADFKANTITVDLHSGKFSGFEIKAETAELDIGSGMLEFAQSAGFKGGSLNVNIGSGKVTVTNADTAEYEISMGSGMFDVSGLTGTGSIAIGSGMGSAEFAAIDPNGSSIDVSSGSLKVYIPRGGSTEIEADISSGSVSVNCCGVSKKVKDDEKVILGSGGAKFAVDVSSGKVSFLDSKKYTAENTAEDPARIAVDEVAVVEQTEF